mmetsp:Transcript_20594/g.57262  ORF Transcript_20594/g.57262 Transcript_20594/m.57262 type:complete len:511 (+) Transcript_20594:47-1579(+)|eukprot:CAMPEP_0117529882 /NCGR_PEP_ID=MMETSP0784-20121206/38059_1 /TAXON_ID=39447 /ORGANISM="" /LENGTH=510 /DNA_ID=CAMNT_0005326213 /DNA_START=19 /DNA_END=1551 /DNA_ORIENTATION=+
MRRMVVDEDEDDDADSEASASGQRCANFATSFDEFVTVYQVPKIVKIRSKLLRVPFLLLQFVLLFIFLPWLIFTLQFLSFSSIESSTVMLDLSPPSRNFDKCHDIDVDCADVGGAPLTKPGYCSDDTLRAVEANATQYFFHEDDHHSYSKVRWPRPPPFGQAAISFDCSRYDVHELGKHYGMGLRLATAITTFTQERCTTGDCLWKDVGIKSSFVENLGHYMVKIRHAVDTRSHSFHSNADSSGFLLVDGVPNLIWCTNKSSQAQACMENEEWRKIYPRCSDRSTESRGACVSTGFADYVTIQKLLDIAGVGLDEPLTEGIPRRWWGTVLKLTIEYSNASPEDAWRVWPPRLLQPKYTYTVKKVSDFTWDSIVESTSPNTRNLTRKAGIDLQVEVIGSMAEWDPLVAARRMASYAVIYEIAAVVFIRIATMVYARCEIYRHAHDIYSVSRFEETVDEEDARGVKSGLDLLHLNRQRNEERAHSLMARNSGDRHAHVDGEDHLMSVLDAHE